MDDHVLEKRNSRTIRSGWGYNILSIKYLSGFMRRKGLDPVLW